MEEPAVNNQIQQSNIPTSPESKHSSLLTSKLFLITLTIAVLFTIVYAGIYLYLGSQLDKISKSNQTAITTQPSPSPIDATANWKKYTNKKYKFSLLYPQDWELRYCSLNIECQVSDDEVYIDPKEWIGEGPEPLSYYIYFSYLANLRKQKFNELIKVGYKENVKDTISVSNELIGNTYVYKVYGLPGLDPSEGVYFQDKDEGYVGLFLQPYSKLDPYPQQERYHNIFDQILSTFKFTN